MYLSIVKHCTNFFLLFHQKRSLIISVAMETNNQRIYNFLTHSWYFPLNVMLTNALEDAGISNCFTLLLLTIASAFVEIQAQTSNNFAKPRNVIVKKTARIFQLSHIWKCTKVIRVDFFCFWHRPIESGSSSGVIVSFIVMHFVCHNWSLSHILKRWVNSRA